MDEIKYLKPVGYGLVALVYTCFILGNIIVSWELIPRWTLQLDGSLSSGGELAIRVHTFLMFYALFVHVRVMLSDPGYTPGLEIPEDLPSERMRYCEICDQYKPDRTHHCRACNRCIHRMDHHCPWIFSCIGSKNTKFFMQFLLSAELYSLGTLISFVVCIYWHFSNPVDLISYWHAFVGLVTIFFSLTFAIFTCIMLHDQIENIVYNQTEIEGLNGTKGCQTWKENLWIVLGPVYHWLNPIVGSPEPDYIEATVRYGKTRDGNFSAFYYFGTGIIVAAFVFFVLTF